MKSVIIVLIGFLSSSVYATETRVGSHATMHHYRDELPRKVLAKLSNRFHHFDLIHTRQVRRRGRWTFDLLIQRGAYFLEVSIGENGRIFQETKYRRFPFVNHNCDDLCSFQYQHHQDGGFLSYDPYFGCEVHAGLISLRYPRYRYRPYYGQSFVHDHPGIHRYKRFRYVDHAYAKGYKTYRRYGKHDGNDHGYGKGKKNRNHDYHSRKHDKNYHRDHDHYNQKEFRRDYQWNRSDDRAYDRYYRSKKKRG